MNFNTALNMHQVGQVFKSSNGSIATIVEYLNNKNVTIEYPSGYRQVVQLANLRRGAFKDTMAISVAEVGSLGTEPFHYKDQSYITWCNMLRRVYKPKEGAEKEAYKDCSVTKDWLLLTNFRKWFNNQIYEKGYQLDKDLLFKNNKIYAPETCIFLPQELNKFLLDRVRHRGSCPVGVSFKVRNDKWDAKISIESRTQHLGLFNSPISAFYAYKEAKELEAKRLAHKWKEKVDSKVVKALLNFTVEITD